MPSAGDYDYEREGEGYPRLRRTEPQIAAYGQAGLGDARSVINVGAGAGSYKPADRYVLSVEPSAFMHSA